MRMIVCLSGSLRPGKISAVTGTVVVVVFASVGHWFSSGGGFHVPFNASSFRSIQSEAEEDRSCWCGQPVKLSIGIPRRGIAPAGLAASPVLLPSSKFSRVSLSHFFHSIEVKGSSAETPLGDSWHINSLGIDPLCKPAESARARVVAIMLREPPACTIRAWVLGPIGHAG